MNDVFVLYLLMQADKISSLLGTVATFGMVGFIGSMFARLIFSVDETAEDKAKIGKILGPWNWLFGITLCMATIAYSIFPSTKTIAVMVGGHYALEASKSDTAKKILDLANAELDKRLDELHPKADQK